MSPRLSLIALFFVLVPLAAGGSIIHVPADQPTIQQGIDAASVGDTVLVAPGTYTGAGNRDIDFDGGSVTLLGEQGQGNTFIDCQGLGRGFYFHSGEDTTALVQGFTIQHAAADSGAGAQCVNYSTPRFVNCTFRLNEATTRGGGVCCYRSSPVLRGCLFQENETAGTAFPYGGALACITGSDVTVSMCDFSNNTAAALGGAVYFQDSDPWIVSCTFSDNVSTQWGGGAAYFGHDCEPTILDCVFTGNHGPEGGAIYTQRAAITAYYCQFVGNSATGIGGAMSLLYSDSSITMVSCLLAGNTGGTGVIACEQGASATVSNCTLVSNGCANGGVLHADGTSPVVDRCIIAFSPQGAAADCATGTENPTFFRCVVFDNAGGDDLCGSVSDTLHRDPRFCGLASGDYYLCQDSICSGSVNAWGELIGALVADCGACGSPVERTTWGGIKALYR